MGSGGFRGQNLMPIMMLLLIVFFLALLILDMSNWPILGFVFEDLYREAASVFFSEDLGDIAAAKRVCAECPVLAPCLEGALARREPCVGPRWPAGRCRRGCLWLRPFTMGSGRMLGSGSWPGITICSICFFNSRSISASSFLATTES